jgi:putative phosphoribosyl transferase
MRFRGPACLDLADGGRQLVAALGATAPPTDDTIMVAILPGGAPVARVVRETYNLDLLAARVDKGDTGISVDIVGIGDLRVLAGRRLLVIDDGVESGRAARAVLDCLRYAEPAHITFAVPVCPAAATHELLQFADVLVAPHRPATPRPLSAEYGHFAPPADADAALALFDGLGLS